MRRMTRARDLMRWKEPVWASELGEAMEGVFRSAVIVAATTRDGCW